MAATLTLSLVLLSHLFAASLSHQCLFPEVVSDYNGYINYWPGDWNLVISAPHGGSLRPSGFPSRTQGCLRDGQCVYSHTCGDPSSRCRVTTSKDSYTLEIAEGLRDEITALTGRRPHLVANMLHRSLLDANRELDEATFGFPDAVAAYHNYTLFVETARNAIWSGTDAPRVGLFLDIHGQTHSEEWVELGYRIDDEDLDSGEYSAEESSIRSLGVRNCRQDQACFRSLINGESSLGWQLQRCGYRVVPSPANPSPVGGGYYRGGYNTERFGSRQYGNTDAIQVEIPRGIRFGDRDSFIRALATSVITFMSHVYD